MTEPTLCCVARAAGAATLRPAARGLHFVEWIIDDYQKAVAHAGADAVVGHHPHVIKGMEVYRGRPIFYSMGNSAFDLPASRRPIDWRSLRGGRGP